MATTSTRKTVVTFSGDFIGTETYSAASNAASPGVRSLVILASGANTITPPLGSTPKAVIIIPPAANVISITLKGVTGDTGVLLHLTDPTVIALGSATNTFVLTAGSLFTNPVQLIWT
jgi:hypothetical protein